MVAAQTPSLRRCRTTLIQSIGAWGTILGCGITCQGSSINQPNEQSLTQEKTSLISGDTNHYMLLLERITQVTVQRRDMKKETHTYSEESGRLGATSAITGHGRNCLKVQARGRVKKENPANTTKTTWTNIRFRLFRNGHMPADAHHNSSCCGQLSKSSLATVSPVCRRWDCCKTPRCCTPHWRRYLFSGISDILRDGCAWDPILTPRIVTLQEVLTAHYHNHSMVRIVTLSWTK